jgi:hypothetical protein
MLTTIIKHSAKVSTMLRVVSRCNTFNEDLLLCSIGSMNQKLGLPTQCMVVLHFIWIARAIWKHHHAVGTLDDPNVVAFSIPANTKTWSYKKIKAYGSHFCVDDSSTISTVIYDSGVATFLSHSNDDGNHPASRQLHYVGVLKEILE